MLSGGRSNVTRQYAGDRLVSRIRRVVPSVMCAPSKDSSSFTLGWRLFRHESFHRGPFLEAMLNRPPGFPRLFALLHIGRRDRARLLRLAASPRARFQIDGRTD